jgi:hypothetical protein
MDTFILAVSTAVLFTLGYGVVWTVRTVRRVGVRRFAGAVTALASALIMAVARLFKRSDESPDRGGNFIDVVEDLRIAREHRRLSEEGTISPPHPYDSSGL